MTGLITQSYGSAIAGVPTVHNGITYRSKLEAAVARDLTERGVGFEYEARTLVYQDGTRRYTPDFVLDNGIMLEVKGWLKREDRQKLVEVRIENPRIDLRLVLADPRRRLDKFKPITAGEWSSKHCWTWCEAPSIPTYWID